MSLFERLVGRDEQQSSDAPPCVRQLECDHDETKPGATVEIDGDERTERCCANCSAMLGWMDQ